MNRIAKATALAALLSACAGPSARGQPAPAEPLRPPDAGAPGSAGYQSQETPEPGWIQVSGNGSVSVQPDRARVAFAMETRAGEAAGAAGANADAMQRVLDALRSAGLPGLELETFGYSLRPEYSTTNNQRTREIVAYIALNNVRATVDDVDAVGRVIDTAIGAGANRVAGIAFFASDTEAAREEAVEAAVRDATGEARVIAETLGYRLGPPLEVNGGAQRPQPRMYEADVAFARAQAAPTPIEAGEQTVTANVSIRFALGERIGG